MSCYEISALKYILQGEWWGFLMDDNASSHTSCKKKYLGESVFLF